MKNEETRLGLKVSYNKRKTNFLNQIINNIIYIRPLIKEVGNTKTSERKRR